MQRHAKGPPCPAGLHPLLALPSPTLYVITITLCLHGQSTALIRQAADFIQEAFSLREAGCCTAPSACAVLLQDCAVVPWFVRGYIMEHFRQLPLPPSDCPKVQLPLLCSSGAVA